MVMIVIIPDVDDQYGKILNIGDSYWEGKSRQFGEFDDLWVRLVVKD